MGTRRKGLGKIADRRPDRGSTNRDLPGSYERRNTLWSRLGCILLGLVVIVASAVVGYIIISALAAGGAQ
jgi:hypothetical protein